MKDRRLRWIAAWTWFAALFLGLGLIAEASAGTVELHAHLFMKEGMTWAFRGDFDGPLRASGYKDKLSTQANPETLEKSGIQILVVSLYAHPLFTLSLRNSIRRQIDLAEKFVTDHPNWIIARNPDQARNAINQGQRVLVLSIEGASGILETEEDLREFIDTRGVRIVTLLHLTDDDFGGVAFLKGYKVLSSPVAWLRQFFHPQESEGVSANGQGLSPQGREMAQALIRHGAWIDLAHASDASQKELIPLLKAAHQPLLYTHTVLRKYHRAERGLAEWQLTELKNTGGYLGLMPSEEMLDEIPEQLLAKLDTDLRPGAQDPLHRLAIQYRELAAQIAASHIAFGTDFNGGILHLPPVSEIKRPECPTGTSLDADGFWNIGQVPTLWQALQKLARTESGDQVEAFLDAWTKQRLQKN